MEEIGRYAIGLCAGALLLGIIMILSGEKQQVKWLCSLVMFFLVLSPVRNLELDSAWNLTEEIRQDARQITDQAQENTARQIRDGIIQRTRAYILDEAESLGAEIQVISLALEEEGYRPVRVELRGAISPYDRMHLSDLLEENLGIGKEEQIWMD